MSQPKLLFVDHSHHQKTRTSEFLAQILATRYQVEVIWDQRWAKGPTPSAHELNARAADAILFFQVLPKLRTLRALTCPNLLWTPMRDGVDYRRSSVRRLSASRIKILNFCAESHRIFGERGHPSLPVQFWPLPAEAPSAKSEAAIFFWARRREISWATLKVLLGDFRPSRIVLRHAPDPGHEFAPPASQDIRDYNIELLDGWMERDAYLAQLRSCSIFMAPRTLEGIGMATLEAMNYGLAVIAPDAPTMNEYITAGRNGWLYDVEAPRPLDFSRWMELGLGARQAVDAGHPRWLKQHHDILEFVASSPKQPRWDWRLQQSLAL